MVSLRRKPRLSYNIAKSLALPDDELSDSEPEVNAEAGPSKRRKARQASLESSGAESAFVPPEEEEDIESDNQDADADIEMDISPDDDSEGEDVKINDGYESDELVEVQDFQEVDLKVPGRRHVHESKSTTDGIKAYSTLNPVNQELLWRDAEYDPRKVNGGTKVVKSFISPVENMAHGPLVPLGRTRLAAKPDGKSLPKLVATSQDLGLKDRLKVQLRLIKFVPSEIPWDAWEGDAWRPGATQSTAGLKGKSKEVAHGYGSVGRHDMKNLHIIDAA